MTAPGHSGMSGGSACQRSSFLRLRIDERRMGGDSPPGDFEHKITSPEAIILLFPSEIQQFLQNCWRALNERPYKIIVGFRFFCACVSMNAVGAAIPSLAALQQFTLKGAVARGPHEACFVGKRKNGCSGRAAKFFLQRKKLLPF